MPSIKLAQIASIAALLFFFTVSISVQAQIRVAVEDGSATGTGADIVSQLNDDRGKCNSNDGHALAWDFPTKWISPDGLTMWCVFSGNQRRAELPDGAREYDRFNIVKATLKLY